MYPSIICKHNHVKQYITLSILILLSSISFGQTTWNGSTSADWHTSSNWSAGVPTASDDVIIPSIGTAPIIMNGTAEAKSVIIQASASLTLDAGTTLNISNSSGDGITSAGTLVNYGNIDIAAPSGNGILNQSILENRGNININNAGKNGILSELSSDFSHHPGGQIDVTNSTEHGVWHKAGNFYNNGSFFIGSTGTGYSGFYNESSATNDVCAIFFLINNLTNAGTFENDGLLVIKTQKPSTSTGSLINKGIVEDANGTFATSQIDNQEIIISKTVLTSEMTSIPNAFNLGANSAFNIVGIYTDFTQSVSAGTYLNNTFTPSPALPYGVTSLIVVVNDPSANGCNRSIGWSIENYNCPTGLNEDKFWNGSVDDKWSNPINWCPEGIPQTGDWINLGANNVVYYDIDLGTPFGKLELGPNTRLTIGINEQLLELDGSLHPDNDHLLINNGGSIFNHGKILIKNADKSGIKSIANPSASIDNEGFIKVINSDLSDTDNKAIELVGANSKWTNHEETRLSVIEGSGGGISIDQGAQFINTSTACLDILETDVIGITVTNGSSLINEADADLLLFDLPASAEYFISDASSEIIWHDEVCIGDDNLDHLKLRTMFGPQEDLEVYTEGIWAVWWYPEFDHLADAQDIVQTLEGVRDDVLNNLNMKDPPNPTFGYYVNIYIHHGSQDAFPDGWAAGVGRDRWQMPHYTAPANLATDSTYLLHEGFHLFQFTGNKPNFAYSGDSEWYVEATAQWYTTTQLPNKSSVFQESLAKAQNPQLALWHAYNNHAPGDYNGLLWAIQPYGLQSYFKYLTVDKGIDPKVITDGFYNDTPYLPQEYHYREIGGDTLRAHFADWAAANTGGFEYLSDDQIAAANAVTQSFIDMAPSDQAHPFALELTDAGTSSTFTPSPNYKPRGWSYNVIKVNNNQAAIYTFNLEGASLGSDGAASHFEARLVTKDISGTVTYDKVPMNNALNGSITKSVSSADTEIYFVICAVAEHFTGHQTYDYNLDIIRS